MSDQNINIRTTENMLCDNDKKLLQHANSYFLKKRFNLGKFPDYKKTKHLIKMNSILCSDNCDVQEAITKYYIDEL